jgi:sugar lactone lactonase YvrE
MVLLYEYLPLLLTLVAPAYLAARAVTSPRPSSPRSSHSAPRSPFIPFLLWWIVSAWIGYSYAGERMPWLTVHVALPMILLSGWLIGRLIESIDWQEVLQRRAWLLALVAPPFAVALVVLIRTAFAGAFRGYELQQLNTTGRFLGGLAGTLAFGAGLGYMVHRSGWRTAVRVLLLVALLLPVFITVRTAWRFCYVNHDYPTEFLVYAHAAPAVNETMRQIDELSRRTAGGPHLIQVSYGADGSTLWYWQLRNYPNATFYGETPARNQMEVPVVIAGRDQWDAVAPYMSADYVVNTYTYMWWPMEDYRNLTWPRITRAITDTQTRAAWWDIWYDRDYGRYDELTGQPHTLDAWPLRSDYRVYVRRDLMAQMWERGMAEPTHDLRLGPTDPYAEGWQELTARMAFGSQGAGAGQFERPSGIAVDDDFIYVADTGNHRIQKFTADGQFVAAWGESFNEPWGVAVAPGGDIFVADTWNHRIQQLDAEGHPVTAWGLFGQFGLGDGAAGQSAFYGPRGVAIGPDGRIYVTDTGNKRVQVFQPDGQFAFQWGGGGVLEGYLDEPVGIAIGPDDALYVADTWNRRVQVFDADGTYLRQWAIAGWDAGLPDEKPYLAMDGQGTVYVTDPGHYRVLVFDHLGNYVLSFGQYGFDEQSFALPTGIAVAEDGSIYVVDSHGARVLVFDPLNLSDQLGVEP